jgi:hypothetical protein
VDAAKRASNPKEGASANAGAFELRVDKRLTNHWYVNGSYTHSKLYGNYSGLGSSDEAARTDTNTNRDFDLPFLNFRPGGGLQVGRLATDRPNTFKFFGDIAQATTCSTRAQARISPSVSASIRAFL